MTSEISIRIKDVNKWDLSPLHKRARFSRNESLNSLTEYLHLLKNAPKLLTSLERSRQVDPGILPALNNFSVEISKGWAVAVVDPDGIGKRALIQLVGRAALANGGRVLLRGRVINLGVLSSLLMGNLTARENLGLICDLLQIDRRELAKVVPALAELTGSEGLLDLPVRRIGARPFADLALSMVACLTPDVIAAEEILPTLSPRLRSALLERFKAALSQGTTIVFSSKKLSPILELSTHLLLINDGQLHAFGPTAEIMEEYGDWVEDAIEASASLVSDPLLLEDDDDLEEAGVVGEEADPEWALDRPGGAEALIAGDGSDPRAERTTRGMRKSSFLRLGDYDYKTRESDLCRLVLAETDPVMFDSSGAALIRRLDGSGQSKDVDRDRPFSVRLVIETREPNLKLRPMVDLTSVSLPAVRAVAPTAFEAAAPGRYLVRFDFPAGHLAERFYLLDLAIFVERRDGGATDMAIWRNVDRFDGRSLSSGRGSKDEPASRPQKGRMGRPLVESRVPWTARILGRDGLVETCGLSVASEGTGDLLTQMGTFELTTHGTELGDRGQIEVRASPPLTPSFLVRTARPNLVLQPQLEFWIRRTFAARVLCASPIEVAEPGLVSLSVSVPPRLLNAHGYTMGFGLRAIDQEAGEESVRFHDYEPEVDVLTEQPSQSAALAFACDVPPVTSLTLPYKVEPLPVHAPAAPRSYGMSQS